MNPPTSSTPGQAAFDQGIALLNKGIQDQGQACLQEAARLGHPHAAQVALESRLAHKVISLAQAGQRILAEACLEDSRWQPPQPSDQMVAQLRQLLKQFQEGQFVEPTNKEGWLNMGATLIEAGKQKEAVFCLQNAIDLDSKYEIAWLNLGLAFSKFNEFQNALLVFDRLLAIKPDSFHGWHFKGMTLGNLHKQEEAVACYDRALKLKPDLAEAWFNKSLAELAAATDNVSGIPRPPEARAQPLIPIEDQRIGLRSLRRPPAVSARTYGSQPDRRIRVHRQQPPQLAAARKAYRELKGELVFPLGARLVDHAIAAHIVGHGVAFIDRHGAGFLDEHVLAGLCRPHRHGSMPAVAGGNQESVNVRAREDFRRVAVHLAVVVLVIAIDGALDALAGALPDVGDADEPHPRIAQQHPQVGHAASADSEI